MALAAGLDLVDVDDVRRSVGVQSTRYLGRVFTEREVADCRRPGGTLDVHGLAARFAAKEATLKALGADERALALRSVEVVVTAGRGLSLALSGAVAQLARERGIVRLAVSLTYTARQACALVLAWDGSG